ncbi:unnamed protein product [Haemonchus placei]|uniref:Uncharacterized protein n=1 Tax=Haemonchus placei TaxID=6290 RepID=A0A0N4XAH1_HAEPC|nr:unnamed protein product [Haemonchus placei]
MSSLNIFDPLQSIFEALQRNSIASLQSSEGYSASCENNH